MIYIGSHLSSAGGFMAMGKHAKKLGANTFAFFTRNPRGGAAKEIDPADAMAFMKFHKEEGMGPLVAHAPYTMNLCSAKEDVRAFGKEMLSDDLKRMEYTPGNYYNFHPGSATGQDTDVAILQIADALNDCMFEGMHTTVLLETMAGKGSEIGGNFKELSSIINHIELKNRIGVCFDTCHVWDGGYDIVNHLDEVLDEFDKTIGLDRLYAVHINDSKNPCDSHKDRHEKIGEGYLGTKALEAIVTHPVFQGKPFILETPNEDEGYAKEIALIKQWL
ncbi:MAG: deoxyribonuclease IV [Lachnospiraceae bacterium]|nr:deoxyribonuclease IV [Lachnospiraceae bacterium]